MIRVGVLLLAYFAMPGSAFGTNERSVGLMQFAGGDLAADSGSVWGTLVWANPVSLDGISSFEVSLGAWSAGGITRLGKLGEVAPGITRFPVNIHEIPSDASHICITPLVGPSNATDSAATACLVLKFRLAAAGHGSNDLDSDGVAPGVVTTVGLQKAGDYRVHPVSKFASDTNQVHLVKVLAGNCEGEMPSVPFVRYPGQTCATVLSQAILCTDPISPGMSMTYADVCPCTCGVCRETAAVACIDTWIRRGCQLDRGRPVSRWPTETPCLTRFSGCATVARNAGRCASTCPANTYQTVNATTDLAECVPCPPRSHAPASSSSCLCDPGYHSISNGVCDACPPNSYSGGSGGFCRPCPLHSRSPAGSPSVSHCMCDEGFSPLNGHCVACARGTYKSSAGQGACEVCPAHTSTATVGATQRSQCQCVPGYLPSNSPTGPTCSACPAGTYHIRDVLSGNGVCRPCMSPSMSSTGGSVRCECNAGYEPTQGNITCSACAAGFFKSSVSMTPCQRCPSSLGPPAATSERSCTPVFQPTPTPIPAPPTLPPDEMPVYPYMDAIRPPQPPPQYFLAPGYYPPGFYPPHYHTYPSHRVVPLLHAMGML